MTFTEFWRDANEYFIQHKDVLRYGQALMVHLYGVCPLQYKSVPDEANPFYDDTKVDAFFEYLSNNWYDKT